MDATVREAWGVVSSIGPYPVYNCGRVGSSASLVLGMQTAGGRRIVGAHARTVWRSVCAVDLHYAVEKQYRVFAKMHPVHNVRLEGHQGARFRQMGGATKNSVKLYVDDVRVIYVLLSEQLRERLMRAPETQLRSYEAMLLLLNDWARDIALNAGVVGYVGGHPFQLYHDLDEYVVDALKRYPVNLRLAVLQPLDVPAAGLRGGLAGASGGARAGGDRAGASGRDPAPAEEDGGGGDPVADPYDLPPESPERRVDGDAMGDLRSASLGKARDAVADGMRDNIQKWKSADVTAAEVDALRVGDGAKLLGGVDIDLLMKCVMSARLVPKDGQSWGWIRRPVQGGRSRIDALLQMQFDMVNAWGRSAADKTEARADRGPMPEKEGMLKPLGPHSKGYVCNKSALNAAMWASSHKVFRELLPGHQHFRIELFAVPGFVSAVKGCLDVAGTSRSTMDGASACSIFTAFKGWIWVLQYLWSRAARYVLDHPDASPEFVRLAQHLHGRVLMHVGEVREFVKMNHGREQDRCNLKRRRELLGIGADHGDTRDNMSADAARRDHLVNDMPDWVASLNSDIRRVAKKAQFHRQNGGPLEVAMAVEMQDVIVRATACSFILCHVRPSLVETACVYMSDERFPACPLCKSDRCPDTAFLVHPTEATMVLSAAHHKAAKGQAKAEPINMLVNHHWFVVLMREWALWGQQLAYTGEVDDATARTDPKDLPMRRAAPKRWMLMKAPSKGPNKGEFKPLKSGDATYLLRDATGWSNVEHKDFRHAFITVLNGLRLSDSRFARLVADLKRKGPLPDWITKRVANCLGNSVTMWRATYDAGECPADAETTMAVLNAQRKHLLLLAALGKRWNDALEEDEQLRDPESNENDANRVYSGSVEWMDELDDWE